MAREDAGLAKKPEQAGVVGDKHSFQSFFHLLHMQSLFLPRGQVRTSLSGKQSIYAAQPTARQLMQRFGSLV